MNIVGPHIFLHAQETRAMFVAGADAIDDIGEFPHHMKMRMRNGVERYRRPPVFESVSRAWCRAEYGLQQALEDAIGSESGTRRFLGRLHLCVPFRDRFRAIAARAI